MKREWLTMAVTGAVAVLVLSGCGDSNGKAPRQQSAPGAKAQAAADAKAKALTGGGTPSAKPAVPNAAQTQVPAKPAAPEGGVRRMPQHRTVSDNNLKQIGVAIAMYAAMHDEMCPPGLSALVQENLLPATKIFIAPYDRNRRPASGQEIGSANTSYVYVGKGLKTAHASQLPVAFEKPDLLGADGSCFVLYLDGHTAQKTVRGKTCKAIAEELLAGVSGPVRDTILANAAAADGGQ